MFALALVAPVAAVTVTTPAAAAPTDDVAQRVGSAVSLQVTTPGFTDRFVRHVGSLGFTASVVDTDEDAVKQDASWALVPGLADAGCYSFESVNAPGQYLRHAFSRVRIDSDDGGATFAADATWCARSGLSGSGVSFESKNYPAHYLRHYNSELWLSRSGGPLPSDAAASFAPDVSWSVVDPRSGTTAPPPTNPPPTNPPPGTTDGPDRGAAVPWTEYQAEDGTTNAQLIGPSRQKWDANHIEAEAVGRKAVRLNQTGDYVSWKTTNAANSLVVRYSIPDSPGGGGIDSTIGLYVDGTRVKTIPLTSRYAWSYLGGTIGDPRVDIPGPQPHTFFDEARVLLDAIPVGATVTLQRDAQDSAAFTVVDLVDLEQVAPPKAMPEGFTSVTEFGIQPGDGQDHADDVLRALQSTKKLWFPAGDYKLEKISGGNVGLDSPGVEVRGAGMWYTNLRGPKATFFCAGATATCVFGDFSILGEAKARAEEADGVQKAFAGPMGRDSLIENVWIEHEVGAIWVGNDPPYQDQPTQNLTIRDSRIRNTYADGINLDNGTSNSLVENVHIRNVGDDAAVVWSLKWTDWVKEKTYQLGPDFIGAAGKGAPDQGQATGNVFRNISVQMPWRANCFAAYGGSGNSFSDSTCEDVLTYPGILIDNEFSPYPFGPELTTFTNITLTRAGGPMFYEDTANPWEHGALKLYLREGDVNDVLVENVDIISPTYSGIELRGYGTQFSPPVERIDPDVLSDADEAEFRNVTLRNINVTDAGTYGIQVNDGGGRGTVTFDGVSVSGSKLGPIERGGAPDSFFDRQGDNPGW